MEFAGSSPVADRRCAYGACVRTARDGSAGSCAPLVPAAVSFAEGQTSEQGRLAAIRAGKRFYKPSKRCRHGRGLRRVVDSVCLFCQQDTTGPAISPSRGPSGLSNLRPVL
jgi:hypothetical protein